MDIIREGRIKEDHREKGVKLTLGVHLARDELLY
jgi:hypothetical protein